MPETPEQDLYPCPRPADGGYACRPSRSGARGRYMRASIGDLTPGPLSPLFTTMQLPAIDANTNRMILEVIGSKSPFSNEWYVTINGNAYQSVRFSAREWCRHHDGDQRIGQASRVLPTTAGTHCQINNSVLLSYQIAFDRLDGLCEQQR